MEFLLSILFQSKMDINFEELSTLYQNVHDMMRERGVFPVYKQLSPTEYQSRLIGLLGVEHKSPFKMLDQLHLLFSSDPIVEINPEDEEEYSVPNSILVYFHIIDSRMKKEDFKYISSFMQQLKSTEVIIVTYDEISTKMQTNIASIFGEKSQIFHRKELMFNLTKHQFVPKHVLLTNQEKQDILSQYDLTGEKFPRMFTTDPVARYYNYQPNDMIRIERPCKLGFDFYYRLVVEPRS